MSDADLVGCHVEQTVSPTQQRLTDVAASIGLSEATFCRVRSDYYEQELAWRRDVLGARVVALPRGREPELETFFYYS